MSTEAQEILDRNCPRCGIKLELAWGRCSKKYYWYHPLNFTAEQQCSNRTRSIHFAERVDALRATEIFEP